MSLFFLFFKSHVSATTSTLISPQLAFSYIWGSRAPRVSFSKHIDQLQGRLQASRNYMCDLLILFSLFYKPLLQSKKHLMSAYFQYKNAVISLSIDTYNDHKFKLFFSPCIQCIPENFKCVLFRFFCLTDLQTISLVDCKGNIILYLIMEGSKVSWF